MDELTNTNSRRKNHKSKDFSGSPLANMFDLKNNNENKVEKSDDSPKKESSENTEIASNKPTPSSSEDVVQEDKISQVELPKKRVRVKPVGIDNKDEDFEVMRGTDGRYKLSQNTIYKKVKNIPRTLSIREDVMLIVDELSKNGSKGYTRGVKSTIVSNGIMRELYEIGAISKTDLKRELRPYE